jgi:hypothetical protein
MRVAICSAGPSLVATWSDRGLLAHPELVITVNAAAAHVRGDWQVSGDVDAWQRCQHRPRVGVCAPRTILQACLAGEYDHPGVGFTGLRGLEWQQLPIANRPHECNYSIVAAVALACELGATGLLPIYGADMGGGTADCSGVDNPERNPVRWARELADLAEVSRHARTCGARVLRILPDKAIIC